MPGREGGVDGRLFRGEVLNRGFKKSAAVVQGLRQERSMLRQDVDMWRWPEILRDCWRQWDPFMLVV